MSRLGWFLLGVIAIFVIEGIRMESGSVDARLGERGEEDSWKLVRFITHLPNLTAEEIEKMKQLNLKGPGEKNHGGKTAGEQNHL